MDRHVGRLMPSQYFDYLPLLGAFTVAGDRFTEKKTGYFLYNISAGIMTGELAGWFSRWLHAQEFHKIRSKVRWEIADRPHRWEPILINLLIGVSLQGMLIAMTVLGADWWGFANAVTMVLSVVVRCAQVAENQAGIDENIRAAEKEAEENWSKYEQAKREVEDPHNQGKLSAEIKMPAAPQDKENVKVIVVMADSRVVTIEAPGFLVKPALTCNPHIPHPGFYLFCRIVGWIAFAVHVISIGMSALHTQIYSVVLIIASTVLANYRVGCQDSHIGRAIWKKLSRSSIEDHEDHEWSCWATSRLKGTVSEWKTDTLETPGVTKKMYSWPRMSWNTANTLTDLERSIPAPKLPVIRERRQDLFVWLNLTKEEEERLVAWDLIPRSKEWMAVYQRKKDEHHQRTRPRAQTKELS